MSEIKTNKISPRKGTTQTIGDSGDTVSLPSGTSLDIQGTYSGINSISWDTTAKTANFTAETNKGYFINTTSGEVTITLPATPVAGSFIGIKDYAATAQTNNIVIGSNGNKIQGQVADFRISTQGGAVNLVYVDSTQGWLTYDAGQASDIAENATFIVATGGTVTTCGNFKIHTFTGPGTFCVSSIGNPAGGPNNVDYVVIAGGGGGGGSTCWSGVAGAGGAGGYRESHCSTTSGCYTASPLATPTSLPISATAYPITVGGGGGPGSSAPVPGVQGSNSIFSTITSTGGGGGGSGAFPSGGPGSSGGSGGGGAGGGNGGGSGNTPPVSPSQGNSGGSGGPWPGTYGGGGGGGATGSGTNSTSPDRGGNGGTGATSSINGTPTARASGGGGSGNNTGIQPATPGGGGGVGSGNSPYQSGGANTGGGASEGGTGGSGIVIIRYKYQ